MPIGHTIRAWKTLAQGETTIKFPDPNSHMSSTTCYTLGYSSFFPCLVYYLALPKLGGFVQFNLWSQTKFTIAKEEFKSHFFVSSCLQIIQMLSNVYQLKKLYFEIWINFLNNDMSTEINYWTWSFFLAEIQKIGWSSIGFAWLPINWSRWVNDWILNSKKYQQ